MKVSGQPSKEEVSVFLKRVPSVLAFFIFFLFSTWLMFHTFGYDSKNHNILIASRLWSDFGSHIPLIRSFSMGDNLDRLLSGQAPQYPIFPGEAIRYHFLFYALVGILEKVGLRLDWALNLPSALGFFLLLLGIFHLSYHLFRSYRVSVLSILFFLFNGSLAFLKFFAQHRLSLSTPLDILRASAFPAFGPWDGGQISAFWNLNIFTNQRHLAWGFALGIWFLVWVSRHQQHHGKKMLPAAFLWGLGIGTLPYFHQPMLLIFAVLLVWYFLVFPRLRLSLAITGLSAALLMLLQFLSMRQSTFHFSLFTFDSLWYPGYLIHDRLTFLHVLSFWIANLGLHALLIPIGFFFIPNRTKKILVSLFLIFTVGNLFKFSMEVAANHKFFNFALILGNIISAYVVVFLHKFLKSRIGSIGLPATLRVAMRAGRIGLLVVLVIFLTLSGMIDFFVVVNDTKGALPDVGNDKFATWIARNTPRDAVFLNSSFLYHPASLAGRNIFLGWPYFAWSAGYDTYGRMAEMKTLYESRDPKVFCPLLKKHAVSYITVQDSKSDPNLPMIDTDYFQGLAHPIFIDNKQTIAVYTTSDLCR